MTEQERKMQQDKAEIRNKLQTSDNDLTQSKDNLNAVNKEILTTQDRAMSGFTTEQRKPFLDQLEAFLANKNLISSQISTLSTDDPKTEIAETLLDRKSLESVNELTRNRGTILSAMVGDLGNEYKELIKVRDNLDAVNKALVDKHLENVERGVEISNQGSLLDDFADPSTEQPSHMDPED